MRDIDLTELSDAIRYSDVSPMLILDPNGLSETYFKYAAHLIMTQFPEEMTEARLKLRFTFSVKSGG
jgi:hypothetical protein